MMAPLGLLSEGEKAEIVEIKAKITTSNCNCACSGHSKRQRELCHAEDMGLREGKIVEVLNNSGHGAMLLKIDESRIAIGRGMAMKIWVRRID